MTFFHPLFHCAGEWCSERRSLRVYGNDIKHETVRVVLKATEQYSFMCCVKRKVGEMKSVSTTHIHVIGVYRSCGGILEQPEQSSMSVQYFYSKILMYRNAMGRS